MASAQQGPAENRAEPGSAGAGDRRPTRVAIVGPVPPFRSGVAQHTAALARALADRADVRADVISFARQYPRMLFPGKDDRDPSAPALADPPTAFLIDSIDPFSWRRAARAVLRQAPDFVVMPAWTFFVAPGLGYIAHRCRRHGIPVVMIVHNVTDHEAAAWRARLSRLQLERADHFVTHNRSLADAVTAMVPGRPVRVHPHPIFEHLPAPRLSLPRRAPLELLFFGLIRPYKGLDVALRGLAASGRRDVHLRIVGEAWGDPNEIVSLIGRLGLTDRVEFVPRYVSDAEAAEYFARADCVVLPYRTVSGSGVVPTAYRYGKPVIVSDLPGLTEVVEHAKTGWISPAEDPAALGALLAGEVSAAAAAAMSPAIADMRKRMSWEGFCAAVLQSGQSVMRPK